MSNDRPLHPKRLKYIREYANGSHVVPATHVHELVWEIERLQREIRRSRGGPWLALMNHISACPTCHLHMAEDDMCEESKTLYDDLRNLLRVYQENVT